MTPTKDRREKLAQSLELNGIDYVELESPNQTRLRVHFLSKVALTGSIARVAITGGESVPTVGAAPIDDAVDWDTDGAGRPILSLNTLSAGDFSFYTLTLTSSLLDPYFAHVSFSFKALCPSDLDCEPAVAPCAAPLGDVPPIDYLAKDFQSFRQALLDFSALRYPNWQERSEADFGVMFAEALSSLADDLSYTQDRVAAESALETATQRRSIVRHARLVDYEPRPATCARVLLQFDVQSSVVRSGILVSTRGAGGAAIEFETGTGLDDTTSYTVDARWNSGIVPYWFDDADVCLEVGATEMWIAGHGYGLQPGQQLLIDTRALNSADAPVRELVTLTAVSEELDRLFPGPPAPPTAVTHLRWRAQDQLRFGHDLTRTTLAGNLVPATQGRRYSESFVVAAPGDVPSVPPAIVRTGPNSTADAPEPIYLYTLRNAPLAYLDQAQANAAPKPEIALSEQPLTGTPATWTWSSTLLHAERFDRAFTIDPAKFVAMARNADRSVSHEYDSDNGDTLRFGDGSFGQRPALGSRFLARYRVGGGAAGNVAADTITHIDPSAALTAIVTNPFPSTGGSDAESDEHVRRFAPQAFRAVQYRAVRAQDYEDAAQRLPWVQRAGTAFRWTGSWLSVFTAVDPKGSERIAVEQHTELIDLLNRYRLAGYESYTPPPRFAPLDLKVHVCARRDAFRGDVERAVLDALSAGALFNGTSGFFHVDKFTFGDPLERSALEAAIQSAYGVAGVESVQYRRRGFTAGFVELPDALSVAANEIVLVDNDPSRPDAGSVRVYVDGGK